MSSSHFSIRSILVLTTVVAGGTAVALSAGGGPALAYGVLVAGVTAHVLAVRVGHSVSGYSVRRVGRPLGPRSGQPARVRQPKQTAAERGVGGRARRAGVAGIAAGAALALMLIVPALGWTVHPMTLVATGCSGASLGGLAAVSVVGICDFFENLKKSV